MKVYETPDVQVVTMAPNTTVAVSYGDNSIPMLSMTAPQP